MQLADKKKIISFSVFLLILLLTLIRENIFLEINAIIAEQGYNNAYFYWFEEVFASMQVSQLLTLKWVLTVSFILSTTLLTLWFIKLWFSNKDYIKLALIVYASLFLLIVVKAVFFTYFVGENSFYPLLRKMVGLLSSPIPLFIFYALFYYWENKKKNT